MWAADDERERFFDAAAKSLDGDDCK